MAVFNHSTLAILTILSLCGTCLSESVSKPVIGILSTPSDFRDIYHPEDFSYIKGTYPEFIEAADGVPIGIPWDLPEKELIRILKSVNGLLLTGGDANLWEYDSDSDKLVFSNFTSRVAFILNYAIEMNNNGTHFPVYGICQGHEVIVLALAGTPYAIDDFVHAGQLDTVQVNGEGRKSRMFGSMPDHLYDYMESRRSMFYHHRYGFNTSLGEYSDVIKNFFKITATGLDDNGKEFIGALEANDYPIYSVQYHPERVLFEWKNKPHFDHPDESAEAVLIQGRFLILEAMKNQQRFKTQEVLEHLLINNHDQVYFNLTWPRVHFYDKSKPITYQIRQHWSDYSDLDKYDCVAHDCSFIIDL